MSDFKFFELGDLPSPHKAIATVISNCAVTPEDWEKHQEAYQQKLKETTKRTRSWLQER